jgi:hypothetical protein
MNSLTRIITAAFALGVCFAPLASAANVAVQPAAESAAAVTIERPAVDPKNSLPAGPARVCVAVADARPCYTPPSSDPPFGSDPKAVDVTLAPGTKAVVFTATGSGGGSGASTIVALLEPKNGRLVDLLPATCILSTALSQYAFWNAPAISKMAMFVSANFVWGNDEARYDAHHYRVSVYTFDAQKGIYVLRAQYVTAAKYGSSQQLSAPADLLQREQPQIIEKLR